jgi:hypothetical protein
MADELNAQRLREVLLYSPISGSFRWCKMLSNKGPVGAVAGRLDSHGHVVIGIDRRLYRANRLAWLYMTGEWPAGEVDHKDTVRENNAWSNLRDVPHAINMQNSRQARSSNAVGLLGVHLCAQTKKYRAAITLNGKCKQLGRFDTPELAHLAYVAAKRVMHEGNTL